MLKNYFKIAFRNLWKNRATGLINLIGLSAGMTTAVFIFLWVQNETSFNNYQPDKNNIYRITNSIAVNKTENWVWESSPMQLADFAKKDIPQINELARVMPNSFGTVVNVNHKLFSEKTIAYVEKTWFNLFKYDFTEGSAATFASDPFSIILTQSKAKKYFGNADAIGQIIKVDTTNYVVRGVVKDNPLNSSFQFDVMLQMESRFYNPQAYKDDKSWGDFNYITFLKLQPNTNIALVTQSLNEIIKKNRPNSNDDKISLRPFTTMYYENDLQSSEMPHGNKKTTYIFSILGILLLLIACINYVNLTTAKASQRAKEVSIRKIVGAQKSSLFAQFIAESLTISLLALIVTVTLIQLLLPAFNAITEKQFVSPVTSIQMWKVLLGTLFFATVLNGIYPALLLSSFKPLNVFRGVNILKLRDGVVRKGLVVFQFSLSLILLVGTIVIYRQLKFIQTTNPGYNISQIMSVEVPWQAFAKFDENKQKMFFASMKKDLGSQSSIADVSTGSDDIVDVEGSSSGNADWDGRDTTFNPTIARFSADAEFKNMFHLQMAAGRWFGNGSADDNNYILNETAVKTLNLHKPWIGQRFTWGGDTGQVIGIVKDFHYKSMHDKIGCMVIRSSNDGDSHFFIKTVSSNIPKAISAAQLIWAKYIPDQPFTYNFLDDSFNRLYKSDIKTSKLIFIFSLIAIIISALGLFSLAAFTAEQKTKEIGIRKVLGASVASIVNMLSKDFIKLVFIAIVIATPLSWFIMNKWLQDFAYRINVSVWILIAAALLAILIAIISVSIQAIKAAIANPVKSLRTE